MTILLTVATCVITGCGGLQKAIAIKHNICPIDISILAKISAYSKATLHHTCMHLYY